MDRLDVKDQIEGGKWSLKINYAYVLIFVLDLIGEMMKKWM